MSDTKAYGAMENDGPAPEYYPDPEAAHMESSPPPPTYTDTQNEPPPPTYESLYGELRAAQQNAKGRGQFLKSVCTILVSTIGFTVMIGILLAIPAAMITIGAINLNNCPLERYIPIWLIVGGAVGAFMQIVSIMKRAKAKCDAQPAEDENNQEGKAYSSFNSILGCFNVAWFLAGNVWVYRNYKPNNVTNPALDDYCDYTTYYMAFGLITAVYACILFMCCCSCCIAMCAGGRSSS